MVSDKAANERARRARRTPEQRHRDSQLDKARQRAARLVAARYPSVYDQLLLAECRKAGITPPARLVP